VQFPSEDSVPFHDLQFLRRRVTNTRAVFVRKPDGLAADHGGIELSYNDKERKAWFMGKACPRLP
jgi:hypothetical protein